MRLVYFAPSDIQVARVDRQCIVNFCDALRQIGVDVELVAMKIRLHDTEARAENPLELYRIREPFPVRLVATPVSQTSRDGWIGLNRLIVHGWRALREMLSPAAGRPLILYSKNYGPAAIQLALRPFARGDVRVVFEAHIPPSGAIQRSILRRCDVVVANTHALADELVARHGIRIDQVVGTHQGVDLDLVDRDRVDLDRAREICGLPQDRRLVVYTGKVYWGYREIEHIVEAARRLRARRDVLFVIVGGRGDHVERWRNAVAAEGLDNVMFTGFVQPSRVQYYQFAADALLLYYPSEIAINRYRSPGKLFEYMASGRPVISVDLPVLREVLGDPPSAMMVPQDDPIRLAETIEHVLANSDLAAALALTSLQRVRHFTWRARARTIIASVSGPTVINDDASCSTPTTLSS